MIVVSATVFAGCIKGEDDPSISFRTRDNRVTGHWKLSKWDGVNEIFKDNDWTRETFTFDGSKLTYYISGNFPVWGIGSGPMIFEIEIKKDGYMWQNFKLNNTPYESNGYWRWSNNNRKKTMIELEEFYLNPLGNRKILDIRKLSHKELILTTDHTEDYIDDNGNQVKGTYRHTFTFTLAANKKKE
jgi:hypothetical protein